MKDGRMRRLLSIFLACVQLPHPPVINITPPEPSSHLLPFFLLSLCPPRPLRRSRSALCLGSAA